MKRRLCITFLLLCCLIGITGCNKDPKPEDTFKSFVSNWEKANFDKMYTQFSADVKKDVNKKEFVDRYKKIYGDIGVNDLKVSFKAPKEEVKPNKEGEVSFTYDVSMNTVAGPVTFTQDATLILEETKKDEKKWGVKWSPSMFFPDMEEGDEIGLTIDSPERGEIVDRNGVALAENGLVYEIGMVPQDLGADRETIIAAAAELLKLTPEYINNKLNASWVKPEYFVPIKSLSLEDQGLAEQVTQLNGVLSKKVGSRVYPYKEATAHLIGYIGTVTAEDLEKLKGKGYSANDVVGKKGLEKVFEDKLRGEQGARLYIKKGEDEEVTLAEKPAQDGETIKLTIDIEVQKASYEELVGRPGAVAAIHPLTGEALALVSSPSFDPNDLVLGISNEEWKKLNDDPLKPLLNRFGLPYAPGSTFKPITAGIALENGKITPDFTIDVKGMDWQKDSSWGGYSVTRVTDPGKPVNLRDAFVYSDNIYFAQAALKIGGQLFESELKKYGFGETFPFEYPLYDSKISKDGLNKEILIADTGYGQGQLEMSPVHLAIAYTPLLNDGNLLKPRLLLGTEKEVWKENVISSETAQIIANDLLQVIEDPNGTGKDARIEGLKLAGKTGTAELKKSGETEGKENGWFVAYNTENPQLLVTMLIEDVTEGSHEVTPRVKAIFEKVFR